MEIRYWSYKTAHERTGLPLGTLYALVSNKKIPHLRLNRRHVLFPADDLLAWLEKHRVESPTLNDQEGSVAISNG
jgi:excisionase family DNA binding protein